MKDDKINNQKIYCSVCGAPNDADAGYCEACGAKIEQVPMYGEMTRKKSSKKGLAVAIILAVFVLAAGVILIFFFLSKKNETEAVHVGREKKSCQFLYMRTSRKKIRKRQRMYRKF